MWWAWFERVYMIALRLYPVDYRREYGPWMLQAARDLSRDAQRDSGLAGVLGLWGRILADTVTTAWATHRDLRRINRMSNFTFGQLTDTGLLRSSNEDRVLARSLGQGGAPQLGLFVVVDGLGGHPDGDKVANLVTDTLTQATHEAEPLETLVAAFHAAHNAARATYPEGVAIVTAVILQGTTAYIAHVGDTRAYLVTATELRQLTTDHTLVQHMIDQGELAPDATPDEDIIGLVYRAIGQEKADLEVDTYTYDLPAGSRLLLCSDGLWLMVEEAQILNIVNNREASPQEVCDQLIAVANQGGGKDNIAAIVVDID